MDEIIKIDNNNATISIPTNHLRWRKVIIKYDKNDILESSEFVLEQKFIVNGEFEWREIPTVE